jgi:hypothetical protein
MFIWSMWGVMSGLLVVVSTIIATERAEAQ